MGQFFIEGKAGFRYIHTDQYFDSAFSQPVDKDTDDWTYLFETEVGYAFAKGLRGYVSALYEYTETENGEDDGVLYMSTGLDYSVSDKFILGVKYFTDANDDRVDLHAVGLNLRLELKCTSVVLADSK